MGQNCIRCCKKKTSELNIHFLENADQNEIARVLHVLEPRNTLFLVASKSFSTGETLLNANEAKKWLSQSHPCSKDLNQSFIGITNNSLAANALGLVPKTFYRCGIGSVAAFGLVCHRVTNRSGPRNDNLLRVFGWSGGDGRSFSQFTR